LLFVNPEANWSVAPLGPFSRLALSPFQGRKLSGRLTRTLVRGKTIWDGQTILAERGYGKFLAKPRS
jgi:allantoinase